MIPVVDLFAGPGGLSEGFSSLENSRGQPFFKICLSIENNLFAHRTLELRSFFRQFSYEGVDVPDDYYRYLQGDIARQDLLNKHLIMSVRAKSESILATLGEQKTTKSIDSWIRNALNLNRKVKDFWVLIGGPPCQAYSVAGRSRNKGIKGYVPENDDRHFLYREYLRIVARHWPAVFIMENVRGILTSKINDLPIFEKILGDLHDPLGAVEQIRGMRNHKYNIFSLAKEISYDHNSYKSGDFVLMSENYGVPQMRHRVFLVGIRDDILAQPEILNPDKKSFTVAQALSGLPELRGGLSKQKDSAQQWQKKLLLSRNRTRWLNNIKKEQFGGPYVHDLILSTLENLRPPKYDRGGEYIRCSTTIDVEKQWFLDNRIKGVCNHTSRAHIAADLIRYLFASCFATVHGRSPVLIEYPKDLLPKHKNVQIALSTRSGNFSDRFKVQRAASKAATITSHIAKDGHYYIHYDPEQCRSLTVREAARLQTFPDNYFFEGPRTHQYAQVGNAVPPLLAKKIAKVVANVLKDV